MAELAVNNCKNINEIWAPYNDLYSSLNVEGQQALQTVNVEWNDLSFLNLSNMNFLQRVNAANNQLITLDVSFCPMLQTVIVSNNDMLTDFRDEGDSMLQNVSRSLNDWEAGY